MRKAFFIFIFGAAFLYPCFSQNMLLLGGEYNLYTSQYSSAAGPQFWSAGIGFNMKILNEYFQNDLMLNLGRIRAKAFEMVEIQEEDSEDVHNELVEAGEKDKLLFTVKDSFYFTLDGSFVGIRAGVFAALGLYDIIDFPTVYDLFVNAGGFAGLCFFPKSLFSLALDFSPGFAAAFRLGGGGPYINDMGLSMSFSAGIRINFDKI